MTQQEDKLLEVLNGMVSRLEPIKYDDFNSWIKPKDQEALIEYEQSNIEVGLAYMPDDPTIVGSSVIAIIATITDVLVGKRLAVILDDEKVITGFMWYQPQA